MDKIKKKKKEGPIAAFFKCSNSSTPKNAVIHTKNTALDMGYSRTYKMRLHMNNLSRVFKKRGFIPSVTVFLKTQPKFTLPNAPAFCSVYKNMGQIFL